MRVRRRRVVMRMFSAYVESKMGFGGGIIDYFYGMEVRGSVRIKN